MNYVSIDIETTGLDPDTCQVLQVAAVIDGDWFKNTPLLELPSFMTAITHHEYRGEAFALGMNGSLLSKIGKGEIRTMKGAVAWESFQMWLDSYFCSPNHYGRVTAAGKNFASFDRQFLRHLWPAFEKRIHHRSIDPGNFFMRWDDTEVPNMKVCCERAGISSTVTHDALDDARQVCELLRVARSRA